MNYISGKTIKSLRERKKYTQKELSDILMIPDKTISKWETDRGLPDISMLSELAAALDVSVAELLTGDIVENENKSANMKKSRFYVCPICSNVIHAMGAGAYSCCGINLPALEAECGDEKHLMQIEYDENELFVHIEHPMNKKHYISFVAYVTDSCIQMEKMYPEQQAEVRFTRRGRGTIYCFCNRHGLFEKKI